jgi:hypothetical protein
LQPIGGDAVDGAGWPAQFGEQLGDQALTFGGILHRDLAHARPAAGEAAAGRSGFVWGNRVHKDSSLSQGCGVVTTR